MWHEAPLLCWHNPCSVLTSCAAAHLEPGPPSCPAQALTPHSGTLYLTVLLTQLGLRYLGMGDRAQQGTSRRPEGGLPVPSWAPAHHAAFPSTNGGFMKPLSPTHLCGAALTHGCPCALPPFSEGSLCALLVFSFCFQRYSFFEQFKQPTFQYSMPSSGYWRGLFSANSCSI